MRPDAHLVSKWLMCKEKAKDTGLDVDYLGDIFKVTGANGRHLGMFSTVDDVYSFLCGYEWGHADGLSIFYSREVKE